MLYSRIFPRYRLWLFACIVIILSCPVPSSSAILGPINHKCNVGWMTLRRDGGRIMDQFYTGTLLMVMNDIRIKDISVLDTRPHEYFRLVSPSLHHCFQWDGNKACLSGRPWTHDCRSSLIGRGKNDLLFFVCRESFDFYPVTHINTRGKTNVFPRYPENVFSNCVIPNMRAMTESFPKYKGTQLSFSGFFRASNQVSCSSPEISGEDGKGSSDNGKPNGGVRQPPFLRHLFTAIICFMIGLFLAFWSGNSFDSKRGRLLRVTLIVISYLITFFGFFFYMLTAFEWT
jgi:hypothetical protein